MQAQLIKIHKNSITNSQSTYRIPSKYDCHVVSKPINPQILLFFKNLKVNRFIVEPDTPLQEALRIYYNEYLQLFYQNKRLNCQFISLIEKKNELAQILIKQKRLNQSNGIKIKRKRRYAKQIKKIFQCPIKQCQKFYGRDGSLTQHMKIKHFEFYQSGQYDIYLNKILSQKIR